MIFQLTHYVIMRRLDFFHQLKEIQKDTVNIRKWIVIGCFYIKSMRQAGVSIEALIEYVSLYRKGPSTLHLRKAILLEQRD